MTEILEGAGFADVTFTDVSEPVYYGPDVDAAMDWVRGFAYTREILRQLDPTAAERAVGRLREALATHLATTASGSTPAAGSSPLAAANGVVALAAVPPRGSRRPRTRR